MEKARIYRGTRAIATAVQLKCGRCGLFLIAEYGYRFARCSECGSVNSIPQTARVCGAGDEVYDPEGKPYGALG